MAEESRSLEYTPSWVVAVVCTIIVLLSLLAERGLHRLGKILKHKGQDALFEALQKLKEELMLLGFISLLLTVSQNFITRICIPSHLASYMLPCKLETTTSSASEHQHQAMNYGRRLLSTANSVQCALGKVPLLSLEALHHLHIFIFVLAVVHVIFCVSTMLLGGAKIRRWKPWEEEIRTTATHVHHHHHLRFEQRASGRWRRTWVVSWMISFFKQFYGSVTKSDYISLRTGFIRAHCPSNPGYDFHSYILRTLEIDFKRIVGISWYLWLFVVVFLLLNIEGWHTYFWLSFLPLVLLLLVGAKLEHVIIRLAEDFAQHKQGDNEAQAVEPSDRHFWFKKPKIVLYLIHFVLFQNAFEIGFFFWIWSTYGFHSCIMERLCYIIPRLIIGVVVQVLCSYSTLPLYALVTQMGSAFKEGIFKDHVHEMLGSWAGGSKKMTKESFENIRTEEQIPDADAGITASVVELSCIKRTQMSSP
ncbi:MLO-like protein 13 [Cornus florida]|uniref:MLO-like protein 13 n=1 Tax=Cornus florida TaxID=4283 RepID=UPI00289D5687|nr:MLO-like protein 13 [Cornus florida]